MVPSILKSKVKICGIVGVAIFGDTTTEIEIGGRTFTFDNEERVYDVQKYLEVELGCGCTQH